MLKTKRPVLLLAASAALFSLVALQASPADAHGRGHWRYRMIGAVAGAVIATAAGAPMYGPPQPGCCYGPPPPMSYGTPYSPTSVASVAYADPQYPRFGLSLMGAVQAGWNARDAVGGVAAALQVRTSPHTMLGFELQSVGARRVNDDSHRNDVAGLLAGRLFFWNAPIAPYLELAGGAGRTNLSGNGYQVSASQLLGRFGVGLEFRLGRHLVLDGQIAQLHRLRLDDDDPDLAVYGNTVVGFDRHERATELRGGIGFRF